MTGRKEGEGKRSIKDGTQMKLDFRYLKNVQKALVWNLEVQI